MKIKIKDIKVDPRKRIRIVSGNDITDLKESIERFGLDNPITLDEDLNLIAGYRRLQCGIELGWEEIEAEIQTDLDELGKFDLEFHENIKRKNLTPYEVAVALSKRKEMFQELHPETRKGGDHSSEEFKQKKKKLFPKSGNGFSEPKPSMKEFVESTADTLDVSKSTVYDYFEMGDAIRQDKITPEIKEKLKRREIAKSKVLSGIRDERLAAKKTPRKPPRKLLVISEEPPVKFCYKCEFSVVSICPMCSEKVLICNKKGILSIKDYMEMACDQYEMS